MLKKLLKYDYKAVFKYWWIAAVSSLILAFGGGGCLYLLNAEKELPEPLNILATLALVLFILSFAVFSVFSFILIFARFYKNFYTDEGYLTFTLPVTRLQLLNSKLIMSVVTLLATTLVYIVELFIVLMVGFADVSFTKEFWMEIGNWIAELWQVLEGYMIVYILEIILIGIVCMVFSTLFLFCCITFASIIAKKIKLFAAIGIYYVANSIFSFVVQMFYVFGFPGIMTQMEGLTKDSVLLVLALVGFGLICFIGIFCSILYILQYWMMDRKLNLS